MPLTGFQTLLGVKNSDEQYLINSINWIRYTKCKLPLTGFKPRQGREKYKNVN
jgi:hypothetical protein